MLASLSGKRGFESHVNYLLVIWPWISLIYKMRLIVVLTLLGHCRIK